MSDVHTDPSPTYSSQTFSSDVAFTPAVKAVQTRKGSRDTYARVEQNGGWRTEIDENLAHFLAETNSFFLATASGTGHPYIQHRGGPKGFVKILDKNTIAFADYSGNRQYITQGNLSENPQAHIFVMDYAHRRRVKIWGEAHVVDDDPALTQGADAARLQGAARAGHPVPDFGVGHQLPAAHPAKIRRGRRRGGAGLARWAHRRTRGGTGRVEGPARFGQPGRGFMSTPAGTARGP